MNQTATDPLDLAAEESAAGCGRWGCDCSRTGDDNDCPQHHPAPDARPDGHGHLVAIDGRAVKFDSIWGNDEYELRGLVAWTHDLDDVEVVIRICDYFEGPFAAFAVGDPYEHFEIRYEHFEIRTDVWTTVTVRRVWERWRPATAEENPDECGSDIVWEECPEPAEGLKPACVVDLG